MLKKVTDKIYIMDYDDSKDRALLALIVGEKSSMIVDAGNSYSHIEEFSELIKAQGIENLKYLGITHWHWDHVFGIDYMKLITVGSQKTKGKLTRIRMLAEKGIDPEIEEVNTVNKMKEIVEKNGTIGLIDIGYDRSVSIDLGDIGCIMECIGGDHASDSSLIFIPDEKTMFLGDAPYRGFSGKLRTHNIENVKRIAREILKYDCERYFTAHKEMYDRKQMEELFNQMIEMGEFAGDSRSYEVVKGRFEIEYGRLPNADEEFFLKAYVDGNISKSLY